MSLKMGGQKASQAFVLRGGGCAMYNMRLSVEMAQSEERHRQAGEAAAEGLRGCRSQVRLRSKRTAGSVVETSASLHNEQGECTSGVAGGAESGTGAAAAHAAESMSRRTCVFGVERPKRSRRRLQECRGAGSRLETDWSENTKCADAQPVARLQAATSWRAQGGFRLNPCATGRTVSDKCQVLPVSFLVLPRYGACDWDSPTARMIANACYLNSITTL